MKALPRTVAALFFVLVAGVVAWLAFAAAAYGKRESPGSVVSGLFMGSLFSFLLVGFCVLVISGSG